MNDHKFIHDLLKEYNLEIDDVRWYLSSILSSRFLSFSDSPDELTRYIWSGELDKDLYNMEEGFLSDLIEQYENDLADEAFIREIFGEISAAKCSRF